jgi:hypothetical protein
MRLIQILCRPLCAWPSLLASFCLGLALAAPAAQTVVAARTRPPGKSPAPANAAPVEPEIPKSVFLVPASAQDGKDPFFPQSTPFKPAPERMAATNVHVVVDLELKGISGTPDRRLAIINGRTFAEGEEGDVPSGGRAARIRVLEIKADSVIVRANNEQLLLRLRRTL